MFPADQIIDFTKEIMPLLAFLDSLGLSPHKHRAVRGLRGSACARFGGFKPLKHFKKPT
jgi:hypothetical protein